MPDIDVDFCINGRDRVSNTWWTNTAAGITWPRSSPSGKLKTRAVIRDVGRALDIPLREVDAIAKMVPDVLNISLERPWSRNPSLGNGRLPARIAELIKICRVLEGLPRHASTHAAGVVIGDKPLVEYLPLYKGKKGEVVTQFDMKHASKDRSGQIRFSGAAQPDRHRKHPRSSPPRATGPPDSGQSGFG
jgi:DNA polymerase-3 subunit alpha